MSVVLKAIEELKHSVNGKKITTDAYAQLMNTVSEAISLLENIDAETESRDYILLKWGSFKGFDLKSEKGQKLQDSYAALGRSMSAMAQKDTEEQKEIMYQMIDECKGSIQNDWDGKFYTKQQAKDYLGEYNS